MLEALKLLITSKQVRRVVLIVALALALVIGGVALHRHVYNNGYESGIAHQTQMFQKQQEEAKISLASKQAQADSDRAKLNTTIEQLTEKNNSLQAKLDEKYTKQRQEVIDYAKSVEGAGTCFRPNGNGLRIINESFPDSN